MAAVWSASTSASTAAAPAQTSALRSQPNSAWYADDSCARSLKCSSPMIVPAWTSVVFFFQGMRTGSIRRRASARRFSVSAAWNTSVGPMRVAIDPASRRTAPFPRTAPSGPSTSDAARSRMIPVWVCVRTLASGISRSPSARSTAIVNSWPWSGFRPSGRRPEGSLA